MMLRNGLRILLISLFILLFSHSPSHADTNVGGRIAADTTWTLANSPYLVTSNVQVYGTAATPVTLTIEPGVVVKFNQNMGIQIGDSPNTSQGILVAQGTAMNHITFTRSGTSGTWAGITFYDKTVDAATIMEYTDVQYSTSIVMNSASPAIRNSTITNVTGYGMNLSSSNPALQNVTISSINSYGLNLTSSNPVMDAVAVTANGAYGIYLSSSSPTITGGSLTNSSTTGHGIYGSGSPVVSNYTISIVNTSLKYGFYISSGATSALSITNSTITNGLYIGSLNITPTITGNTFTDADNSPIHAGANIIGSILNNNIINSMTSAGKIEVVGEQVKQDAQWKKWAAPYVVALNTTVSVYSTTTPPATLTIDPGVTVKFPSGYGLTIGNGTNQGGALVAGRPAEERVTFTRSATSGTWSGLAFYDGTVDSATVLENVDVQYSSGVAITSASPVFRNCTITDMAGYVSLSYANPTLENVTITNSNANGIYLASSSPIITGGSITNTYATGQGISGSGSPIISNYSVSIVSSAGKYGINLGTTSSSFSLTNSTIANGLFIGSINIVLTTSL